MTKEKAKIKQQKTDAERDYVFMLLILTLWFLFSTLLSGVFVFWNSILTTRPEPHNSELIEFTENMNSFANVMNNSLNFVFYYLEGKLFREALQKALKKKP